MPVQYFTLVSMSVVYGSPGITNTINPTYFHGKLTKVENEIAGVLLYNVLLYDQLN